MAINIEAYEELTTELTSKNITLIAVSKTKSIEEIKALYELGQRDFGENYVQELLEKKSQLPEDIRWHFIGHLQSNKVKSIASFIDLVHGVDGMGLMKEINKQAHKNNRSIKCLLQVHIAKEETKFGLDEKELDEMIKQLNGYPMGNARVTGLMGMASFSSDMNLVRSEFSFLNSLFKKYQAKHLANIEMKELSMGMSADYKVAIEEGCTMVRIGSLIFGERQ